MNYKYRNYGSLLFVLAAAIWWCGETVLCHALPGYHYSSYSGFVFFFIFVSWISLSWNSFENPFLVLLPVCIYYVPQLFVLFSSESSLNSVIGWLIFTSVACLWLGFFVSNKSKEDTSFADVRTFSSSFLFLILVVLVSFSIFDQWLLFVGGNVSKGVSLLTKDLISVTIFGVVFLLSCRSALLFILSFFIYFTSMVFGMTFQGDISRFGLLKVMVMFVFSVHVLSRGRFKPISVFSVFLLMVLSVIGVYLVGVSAVSQLGGDALILSNVRDVLEVFSLDVNLKHEPLMPLFNAGWNLFPGDFWPFGSKPVSYNPSAWYLMNVLGVDPSQYPWGVGLGGVGAAYIYGGVAGIVLLYFFSGLFFGYMLSRVRNSFQFGVYVYFVLSLPFSLYRMDETFLVGVGILMLPCVGLIFSRRLRFSMATR